MSAKSIGNSLFNVVSGGKHSITPTDAIRTILSADMTLTLRETRPPDGKTPGFTAEACRANGGRVSADGERLDETLHNLVKELLDEKVVERTDWSIPHGKQPMFSGGECAFESWVPYFSINEVEGEGCIDAWIGSLIREKKKDDDQSGPIFLVVAHDDGDPSKVAIGTLAASPIPPVGAVLLNRIRYTAEETEKLMALEPISGSVQASKASEIHIDMHPGREFVFSANGVGVPGKAGKISWEIYHEKALDVPIEDFSPRAHEADDLYETLAYRFDDAGTYRVRLIVSYNDKDYAVRDLIVDVG